MATMTHSERFDQIAKAICDVQRELRPAKRNASNQTERRAYSYSDLASVVEACRKALGRNHIAVFQAATSGAVDGIFQVDVWTKLVHYPSSQWVATTLAIPTLTDAKSIGSAITYGRRYALATLVGVVAESEDDDGDAAGRATTELQNGVPGAMDTSRIRVLEVLKQTKRKFRPYFRFKGNDGHVYGTANQSTGENFLHWFANGLDLEVTWRQVWETREIQAVELLSFSLDAKDHAEPAL